MNFDECLSDDETAALLAIVTGPRAWTSAKKLRRRFGEATIKDLEEKGWLEPWLLDSQGRPLVRESVTLSPWGAYTLGVEIEERVGSEIPYWIESGKASGPIWNTPQRNTVLLEFAERVPDPSPGPEFLADLHTGELTSNLALAALLLRVPVRLDPRLRKLSATVRRRTRKKDRRQGIGRSAEASAD